MAAPLGARLGIHARNPNPQTAFPSGFNSVLGTRRFKVSQGCQQLFQPRHRQRPFQIVTEVRQPDFRPALILPRTNNPPDNSHFSVPRQCSISVLRAASFSGTAATAAAIRSRLAACSHRLIVRCAAFVHRALSAQFAQAEGWSSLSSFRPWSSRLSMPLQCEKVSSAQDFWHDWRMLTFKRAEARAPAERATQVEEREIVYLEIRGVLLY